MLYKDISICFHTEKIKECKEFYEKYFEAKTTFDAGWYVTLHLYKALNPYLFISFMTPQSKGAQLSHGGTTLNLMIDDVDVEYERMKSLGAEFSVDIADQPWGDRSFRMVDPIGNVIYIYAVREMEDEYKNAVKK